jgi:NinB protein
MPVTIILAGAQQRAQAIQAVENAIPRTRVTFSDPALSDQQLTLLRILASDLASQVPIERPMPELERLLTAAMWCDQGMPGFEDGTMVVRGVLFEELSIAQASEMAEFIFAYGDQRGVIFREKKPT